MVNRIRIIQIGAAAGCLAVLSFGCAKKQENDKPSETATTAPRASAQQSPKEGKMATLQITSSAFQHQQAIPKQYTCQGQDTSPPLAWEGLPEGTKSLALIVDDPDAPDPAAPKRVWVHWVLYDIPPTVQGLPEAVKQAPAGARDGKNDWGRTGYGGPCPPIGRHRYFHKLYALDTLLGELGAPTKTELEKAMRGHIVGQAEIIGTYQKDK
jgi:Raf kinase inhibitor-like YbhB/YbcL family protein